MKGKWSNDHVVVADDTDITAMLSVPEVNPYMGDQLNIVRTEQRENIEGFTQYSEDSWLSYRNGLTAVLAVNGMLVPDGAPWHTLFGVTPLNVLEAEYATLEADPEIDTIITKYNSPGGVARGLTSHHKMVTGLKTKTIGYVGGISASASYFAMSANDEIVADEMAIVGSIGTIMHIPKQDADTVTIVSEQSPLKDKSDPKNYHTLQSMANNLTDIFHKYVASGMNVSVETVAEQFGKGDIFLAEQALERGMIHRIATFKELLDTAQMGNTNTSEEVQTMKEFTMDVNEFQAEHPALFAEVQKDSADTATADAEAKMSAESERIQGVMSVMAELGELSPVATKAAMSIRDKAITDPSMSVASVKADMCMAALQAKETSDSTVAQHGEAVAQQAEAQGSVTPEQKAKPASETSGGLMESLDAMVKQGVDLDRKGDL